MHITTVSTAEGVALVRKAKQDGLSITAAVAAHHHGPRSPAGGAGRGGSGRGGSSSTSTTTSSSGGGGGRVRLAVIDHVGSFPPVVLPVARLCAEVFR